MKKIIAAVMALLLFTGAAHAQTTDARLAQMSVEEKVAQLFLARCPSSGALSTVEQYQPGGYILFANHFEHETRDSISEKIAAYQGASKIPMLIGVDEEGGTVTRVSRFKAFRDQKFQSPRSVFESGGYEAIIKDAREKSALLRSLGVNFNLAPVLDLSGSGDYMYARSFSDDPELTSMFASIMTKTMNDEGMLSALKHFPGYGNNKDTHVGFAVDKRSKETFESRDFLPFRTAIDAGAGCVLVSHTIVNCMDENNPASLSPEVHRVLREELGFDGVIMTDDLYMNAIKLHYGVGEAAVLAIEAGNDLLCSTNFVKQYEAVLSAVQSGRIPEARIDQSVARILAWKASIHLF